MLFRGCDLQLLHEKRNSGLIAAQYAESKKE